MAFATLRFVGDNLDPNEISRVIKVMPTKEHKKDQTFRSGPYGPDITGNTGVWYLSTRQRLFSENLNDHLREIDALVAPFGDNDNRLRQLRDIMERKNLQAHVSLFWMGPPNACRPPFTLPAALSRIPVDIERDFEIEDC